MRATLPLPQPVWDTAEAGRRAGGIAGTQGYTDQSLPQHLLQAKAAYDDQIYNRLMEYGAQLQVLGVLAGVFDTTLDGVPAETLRREVAAAVAQYSVSLTERSKREHWYEGFGFLDASAISLGYLMQGGGWVVSQLGADETGAGMSKMGQTLRKTDPNKLIYNVASDYIAGLIDSAKARWDEFWTDVETKGYLVAVARIKADADFLGAEIAMDIAMGVVSGGVATGVKIVAKRLAGEVTEIAIRVTTKVARAVPDAHVAKVLRVADADIDPKITREILDEDKLGTGSHSDDLARRAEQPDPAKETRDGAAPAPPAQKTMQRGGNEQTITYDPQTGRPISSSGTIRQDFGSSPRYDNATAVGKLGNPGDQGGHLAGHRFFGDTPDPGIAPQAGNLNMGAWKTMENEWADWTRLGYEVDYKIDVYPPGAVRPDMFRSSYVVRDPKTGKVVYKNDRKLKNRAGQAFKRITWRDMQDNFGAVK